MDCAAHVWNSIIQNEPRLGTYGLCRSNRQRTQHELSSRNSRFDFVEVYFRRFIGDIAASGGRTLDFLEHAKPAWPMGPFA